MRRDLFSKITIISILLFATLMLAACNGSTDTTATTDPISPPPVNSRPTIAGAPATSSFVGEQYEFVPTASDPDNDPITFSITGQPEWTTFDASTGRLHGMPDVGDVSSFENIIISVSDGTEMASLAPFSITVQAIAPVPAPFGLDSRPSNLTCLAVAHPGSEEIILQRVFPDLSLDKLTVITQPPNDSGVWYFATRDGLIGRFDNTADISSFTTVLDHRSIVIVLSDGGLIQFTFHPNYPADHRVFVNYSVSAADGVSSADIIISSFEMSVDGLSIDPQSEAVLLRFPRGQFHQGGFMSFDRDGLLLLGFGDGTDQRDPTGRAQDLSDFRGKMLRINVDMGTPYNIPSDNPFAGSGGFPLEEIFALGLRNPYRGDIDPESGRIYVADVGLGQREEISEVFPGANLGWNIKEGTQCLSEQYGSCSDPTLVDPLVEYSHSGGNCAVIGGYFYRGQAIPELHGHYVFADYCTSKISAVDFESNGQAFEWSLLPGGTGLGRIISFAKDNNGELYTVTRSRIHKILPNSSTSGPQGPASLLSQTGCFDSSDAKVPAAGLIPYDLKSALWSDGASKRRWIALPDGRTIDLTHDGDLLFPDGTVLVKEFSIDGQRVETRLFMRDENGFWGGYSYEWIGDDAFLLPATKQKVLPNGQIWHFPNRGECLRCHTSAADFALGPEIGQLNGNMTYPQTNRTSNQLATIEHIGLLTNGLPNTPDQLPAFAGLDDVHQAVSRRARSYLHSNCSGCHRDDGPTQSSMDLRFATSRTAMNVCNMDPTFGDLGISGAKILAPGQPSFSLLAKRPASTDPFERMPPLATFLVHDAAISVLNSWIISPDVCTVESDSDLDRVPDDADNCPGIANPDQSDVDKDQVGDLCDIDADGAA